MLRILYQHIYTSMSRLYTIGITLNSVEYYFYSSQVHAVLHVDCFLLVYFYMLYYRVLLGKV